MPLIEIFNLLLSFYLIILNFYLATIMPIFLLKTTSKQNNYLLINKTYHVTSPFFISQTDVVYALQYSIPTNANIVDLLTYWYLIISHPEGGGRRGCG